MNVKLNEVKLGQSLEEQGLMECPHCHGYGSSFKDPEGINVCTRCGGSGVIRKEVVPE